MSYRIIVLNTGSTSTKMALYIDDRPVLTREEKHSKETLALYPTMADQWPYREEIVRGFVREATETYGPADAFVSRGGHLPPVQAGGYEIGEVMIRYLLDVCRQEHASNLAACIAWNISREYSIPRALIYDSVAVDQLDPLARVGGIPELPRRSITHALNMRAIARRVAERELGRPYEECTLIVAHLGGGISFTLHRNGQLADMISDDEGAFAPERAGRQQGTHFVRYLYDKGGNLLDHLKILRGGSGLVAHLGTSDAREVERRIASGDEHARLVYEAMAYQVAKGIGELSTVVCGKVDRIALTGGMAYSEKLTGWIIPRVEFIAPVCIYPGENEMESLAGGALRILRGEEQAREFVYRFDESHPL